MTSRRLAALVGALAFLTAAGPAAAAGPAEAAAPAAAAAPAEAAGVPAAVGVPVAQAAEPAGGTVLFNQLTDRPPFGVGMPVLRADPKTAFDAEGVDDFEVFDPGGWTIGEVVFGTPGIGLQGRPGLVDVRVYQDVSGRPDGPGLCEYVGIVGQQHGPDQLRVPLPDPCVLDQGRYWLSLQSANEQLRWAVGAPAPLPPPFVLGETALWRNPGDGLGTGCFDWSDPSTCLLGEEPVTGGFGKQALFQVCGAVGRAAERFAGCGTEDAGIGLTVTLAVDNGQPDQCGTATALDVDAGARVNVCYTATNAGNAPLGFHWLRDNLTFRSLTRERTLAPGQSVQFNRLITAVQSQVIAAESQATDVIPWYFPVLEESEFIDIAGSGTPLNLDDDGSATVTMPFRFSVFGSSSDQVCINNNGFLLLDWDRLCDGFYQDASVPNESVPIRTSQVAPFWDDLFTGGNVYYGVVGAAPNRRFVVQWDEKNHYNNGTSDAGGVTFEAILDEATQNISFQYQDTTFDNPEHQEWDRGGHATVGFQGMVRDGFGGPWREHSFHAPVLDPGSGLTWRSMGFFHATANATATLNIAAPAITATPEALAATTVQGGSASLGLRIGNAGDRDLLWQVGAVSPSTSHFPTTRALTSPGAGGSADADRDSWGLTRGQKPARVARAGGKPRGDDFPTPAFAVRFEFLSPPFGPRYDRINDLADPEDTVEVASLTGRDIFGGEFVDNDFSRQITIDECCRNLVMLDTKTGEPAINLGTVQGSEEVVLWHGMAWDSTTDTLYAVGTDTFNALPDTRFFLARLDIGKDVVATTIGELPSLAEETSIIEIAVDPAGRMFGVDIQGNRLFAIDKQTADAKPIGELGFNPTGANGLDFDDATNTLYLASLDAGSGIASLYTVDTLTGEADAVGQLGNGAQYTALAIASGAPCVPPTEVPWLTVKPRKGTTGPGGTADLTVRLDATGLPVGTHQASVCVASNDPARPVLGVPVTLTVVAADADITLRATGRRVAGVHHVDLVWQGTSSANVDIYRDGALITTVANDGAHTDATGGRGEATYRYWVCEAGTSDCSSPVVVKFGSPPPGQ